MPRLQRTILFVILALTILTVSLSHTPQPAEAQTGQFFLATPQVIPLDNEELVNPMRGFYRWNNNENVPLPRKAFDAYARYQWRDLEPARDKYDFSKLEREIARAAAEGRRYSFRVRAMVSKSGTSVPDYLMDVMEKGWWHDYSGDGSNDTYVPDWNDPDFMDRAGRLLAALGERYNDDPRVGWLDIGIYGNWGEWHTYSFPYPTPQGADKMTTANRHKIVDAYMAAFPDKRLIMPSDDKETLRYALQLSPSIGWRRDSLGVEHFESVTKDAAAWAIAKDRWKTAPVVTEFINPGSQKLPEAYILAAEQVEQYHVSLVSNGNTTKWDSLSASNRDALEVVGKVAGYRYVLQSLRLVEQVRPGRPSTAELSWCNVGSAPTYDPWEVALQLRGANGKAAWEHVLGGNLGVVLPEADQGGCALWSEQLSLPASLPEGVYTVSLTVRDPGGYFPPMALAVDGRQSDGSYTLGQISVGETGQPLGNVHITYLPLVTR